jgi:hypothetical protein
MAALLINVTVEGLAVLHRSHAPGAAAAGLDEIDVLLESRRAAWRSARAPMALRDGKSAWRGCVIAQPPAARSADARSETSEILGASPNQSERRRARERQRLPVTG